MKNKMSDIGRKNISDARKKYLKDNPDKHPWKKSEKFKSIPCEKFKDILRSYNVTFIEEYTPLYPDYFYACDICFPDKKIIIEINGNQHYNSDGSLKQYYQKRHNILESYGWKICEIPYKFIYDEDKVKKFIDGLIYNNNLTSVDYETYAIKKIKKVNFCKTCNKQISIRSEYCRNCYIKPVKKDIQKNELEELIKNKSFSVIAKIYGVSDKTIKNKCILYGIDITDKIHYEDYLQHPSFIHCDISLVIEDLQNMFYKDLCSKYKCSKIIILNLMKQLNITKNKEIYSKSISESDRNKAYNMKSDNISISKISKILNISFKRLKNMFQLGM